MKGLNALIRRYQRHESCMDEVQSLRATLSHSKPGIVRRGKGWSTSGIRAADVLLADAEQVLEKMDAKRQTLSLLIVDEITSLIENQTFLRTDTGDSKSGISFKPCNYDGKALKWLDVITFSSYFESRLRCNEIIIRRLKLNNNNEKDNNQLSITLNIYSYDEIQFNINIDNNHNLFKYIQDNSI